MAEVIKMLLSLRTQVGPRNHLLDIAEYCIVGIPHNTAIWFFISLKATIENQTRLFASPIK